MGIHSVKTDMFSYNIMYILNDCSLGGAVQSLIDILVHIKDKGIKSVVVIPQKAMVEDVLKRNNIPYYVVDFERGYGKIGMSSKYDEDRNFWNNYTAALYLQEIIKKEQIDLIHINSSVTNVGAFAAIIAGIPYVWHIREFLEEDLECEFWDKDLKKKLFLNADKIITISNCVRKSFFNKYGVMSEMIYNGIDYKRYKQNINIEYLEQEQFGFIIIGNITEGKGQFDAVKAVKVLVDEGYNNIHLYLIGNEYGNYSWIINKYISQNNLESNIKFVSFQKELTDYRQKCQYSLTTSRMEALGRCTIEAMMAGNFVIGANTGGTLEIIGENNERGLLYQQGDCMDLAETIKKAITMDRTEKNKCMHRAQEYAINTFDTETYEIKIINIYREVIEKKEQQKNGNLGQQLRQRYEKLNQDKYKKHFIGEKGGTYNTRAFVLEEKWNKLNNYGGKISDYFKKNNLNKIAIYGMGKFGSRLYDELLLAGVKIEFAVDKNPGYLSDIMDVKKPEDKLEGIDILVVAVANEEKNIVNHYKMKNYNTIGISEILDDLNLNF